MSDFNQFWINSFFTFIEKGEPIQYSAESADLALVQYKKRFDNLSKDSLKAIMALSNCSDPDCKVHNKDASSH